MKDCVHLLLCDSYGGEIRRLPYILQTIKNLYHTFIYHKTTKNLNQILNQNQYMTVLTRLQKRIRHWEEQPASNHNQNHLPQHKFKSVTFHFVQQLDCVYHLVTQ